MNAWFDDFGKRCVEIAGRFDASIDAPQLESDVSREVLELTRVVAHASERQFAPLAAFVAGRAVERIAAVRSGLNSIDAGAFIAELTRSLEVNEPA